MYGGCCGEYAMNTLQVGMGTMRAVMGSLQVGMGV